MSSIRKKFGCKEDVIIIAVVIFAIIMILPALSNLFSPRRHRRSSKIYCTSNLKQIGLALKQYAMDYEDYFPPENNSYGLDMLRELDYLTDYGVYVCPEKGTPRGTVGIINELNCDYIYIGGLKEGKDYADVPLAFDKPNNHKNYFNVLFLDGHVKGYPITVKNCEDVIIYLHSKHKYKSSIYTHILSKAQEIDTK
jgi:prepilin-type processing-associated H-X9-DG protein